MKPFAKRIIPLGAILTIAAVPGCKDPSASQPAKTRSGFIAVVAADPQDPRWPILKRGAEQYGARQPTYDVRCLAPSATTRSLEDVLRPLLGEEIRGLCILAPERQQPLALLRQLRHRGAPVISLLRPLEDSSQFAEVAYNNVEIGQKLADLAASTIGDGTIMVLHAGRTHPVYGPRLMGFEKQMLQHARPEVFATFDCHLNPEEARAILRERAQKFPRLSAWVFLGEWPVLAAEPLDQMVPAACRIITFGCPPALWPLIRSGKCAAAVDGDYSEFGARAIQLCEVSTTGNSDFRLGYQIPSRIITPTNLEAWIRDWQAWSGGPTSLPGASPATSTAPGPTTR